MPAQEDPRRPGLHRRPELIGGDQVVDVDAVVAAHYAGVNPDDLRVEYLSAPVTAHVSYRIGDDIYWTRRPVTLPAGERVLTSGTAMIRARCGNMVSMEPMLPVAGEEPAGVAGREVSGGGRGARRDSAVPRR